MLFLTSSHALLSHELGSVVGRDKKKLTSYIQLPVIPARYLHFFSDVLEGESGQRIPHPIVPVLSFGVCPLPRWFLGDSTPDRSHGVLYSGSRWT